MTPVQTANLSKAKAVPALKKLSIVIPVHNEQETLNELLEKVNSVQLGDIEKEIIVVDDASTDQTLERLTQSTVPYKLIKHRQNKGKGGGINSGFSAASGDVFIIQDADLEYDPNDYQAMIEPILKGEADAVMGSRFLMKKPSFFIKQGDRFFSHYLGNKAIIMLTNLLYGFNATDYEGCYKAFSKEIIQQTPVVTSGFDFDNELICKLLRKKARIVEVPIHYYPRMYSEGKKIRWFHGVQMIWSILKWRIKRI